MTGKIIVLAVIVLIVILVIYLMHDSELVKGVKKSKESVAKSIEQVKSKNELAIANGPIIHVKYPGGREYHKIEVTKKLFKIGRGNHNDLNLEMDKTVENNHAVIVKKLKGDVVFYELINYAKVNPVQYFEKKQNAYVYLGYKDGVELSAKEAFYIGETKIIIVIPIDSHIPSGTERVLREEPTKDVNIPTREVESNRTITTRIARGNSEFDL